ncbi:O-methyltransferase [Candidatus Protochlamydia phocaeensis]|uniref:O-methyltransferase n=1 Tax=Candidatus Protochlamydia phocaeensis TaxID=1414722 RepID=UPI0008383710|nr:O-methyltransferase [Candidatus Protochlamydia phocaeensis]
MNESLPPTHEIKDYLDRRFGQEDEFLHAIRTHSLEKGLPEIQIPIYLGRFLYLMAKIQAAERILEIGVLGGYSTVCLARALPPQGKLLSLEINPFYAQIAQDHLVQAGLAHCVEIRLGHAVDQLAQLAAENLSAFDLIFIDADKENNALYLDWALHVSRPGSLILIDNLIPKGPKVGYPSHQEAEVIYAFNDYLARHPRLESVVIPTLVGPSGRLDGLAVVRVI